MTAATRDEFGGMRFFPLTVRQYHRMIEQGILPEGEPYELLGGQVVRKDRSARGEDPMTVGHQHAWVVKTLGKEGRKLEKLGCHLQTQQPISLPPRDEPEPDAAIIVGSEDDYMDRHPAAADVLCVIEVADASLLNDRTIKLRAYADAGIPMYIIINLPDRMVEVYTEPLKGKHRYGQSVTLGLSDKLTLPGTRGRQLTVPVKRLFP
jgi:hypothetical protein